MPSTYAAYTSDTTYTIDTSALIDDFCTSYTRPCVFDSRNVVKAYNNYNSYKTDNIYNLAKTYNTYNIYKASRILSPLQLMLERGGGGAAGVRTNGTIPAMSSQRRFRLFLVALAVLGGALLWLATGTYGPGVSTDGARYLSAAQNIAAGQGDIDFQGGILTQFPPLYTALIAAFSLITGADVLVAGQVINILAFGGIIFLSGLLFERSFPGNWTFAAIASIIVAFSLPLLEVSAGISSDPLFMASVLGFLLIAQRYLESPTRANWGWLAAAAVVATFLRYAGLALVISGVLLVALAWRKSWPRAAGESISFGLLTLAPITLWGFFHNFPVSGEFFGSHQQADLVGNIISAAQKFTSWFLPANWPGLLQILMVATPLLVLISLSTRERGGIWLQRLQSSDILPIALFFAVYGAMLIFAISYSEHRYLSSQRIHVIILPALLVLIALTAQIFAPRLTPGWRNILFAFFGLWLAFPLTQAIDYVSSSRKEGDVSDYNVYNTGVLRESDIFAALQTMQFGDGDRIFSNNEAAAWLYTRQRVYSIPHCKDESCDDFTQALQQSDSWPKDHETAILIWFKRDLDYKGFLPTPELIQQVVSLTPTFTGRFGVIYRIGGE